MREQTKRKAMIAGTTGQNYHKLIEFHSNEPAVQTNHPSHKLTANNQSDASQSPHLAGQSVRNQDAVKSFDGCPGIREVSLARLDIPIGFHFIRIRQQVRL